MSMDIAPTDFDHELDDDESEEGEDEEADDIIRGSDAEEDSESDGDLSADD